MNDKEIGEIRRHLRRDRSNITAIYGCYVNENKEIITEFRQSTGMMPENESDKYFALLRRTLSGSIGKNLIDITFKTSQVADSPEHKLLMGLRESKCNDEALRQLLKGKLVAFTGNSGVGKSSILNALDPDFQLKVGEISDALGRGRHTTRHVELFRLSCGAEVVDSPGFSSFETDELNLELKHRLPETFRDFVPYLGECRFVGCNHTKEKGCAVLEARKQGKIQRSRHESYLRLYEELKPLKDWQENKK